MKKLLVILYIIGVLDFFSAKFLPDVISYYYPLIMGLIPIPLFLFLVLAIKKKINSKGPLYKSVIFLYSTYIISIFSAYFINNQKPLSTILSMLPYFAFLLIFILQYFSFKLNDIENIIKFMFFSVVIIFFMNYITYPDSLFIIRSVERRGAISFLFLGQGFLVLGGLMYLNKYLNYRKLKHIMLFVLTLLIITFLTQSRTMLFGFLLGSIFIFYKLINFKNRILKNFIIVVFVFLFIVIINKSNSFFSLVFEETQSQIENRNDDLRFLAATYFLTTFSENPITIFVGNGIPGDSEYGESLNDEYSNNMYSTSDVGIIGYWVYFGLIGVFSWILLFYNSLKCKTKPNNLYAQAYVIFLISSILTNYTLFDPGFMPATALTIFILNTKNN